MFTRGCPCLRSCKLSSFLDSAPTSADDPLYFLYPRWTASVLASRSLAHRRSFFAPRGPGDEPQQRHFSQSLNPKRPSVTSPVAQWLSSRRLSSSAAIGKENASVHQDARPASGNDSPSFAGPESKDRGTSTSFSGDRPLIRKVFVRREKASVLRQKFLARVKAKEDARLNAKNYPPREREKLRYRRYVAAFRRSKGRDVSPVHWVDLMMMLEGLQNRQVPVNSTATVHEQILVPEVTVVAMSGSVRGRENIWRVPVRTGCEIRVLDSEDSEGIYRKVILSGSERAVEMVKKQFREFEERRVRNQLDMKVPALPILPSIRAMKKKGQPVPLVRGVWYLEWNPTHLNPNERRPLYSVREFAHYVEELTRSEAPKPRSPVDAFQHYHRVRRALLRLFSTERNERLFSTDALNSALEYLCSKEHLSAARAILAKAEHVASTDSFNILLRCSAKRQDMWFFRYILSSMDRLNVPANGETWVSLLQCLLSPGPKMQVMRRMRELGYLEEPRILRQVLEDVIGLLYSRHVKQGGDLRSFIDSIERAYGTEMVSTTLLNRIIEHQLVQPNVGFLEEMMQIFREKELWVDTQTLNLICLSFQDIDGLLEFFLGHVRYHPESFKSPNYGKMFKLAYEGQYYNTCRVLWRYACMEEATTKEMRQWVRVSLLDRTEYPRRSQTTAQWRRTVGPLVVGVQYNQRTRTGSDSPPPLLGDAVTLVPPTYRDNPVLHLLEENPRWGPDPKTRRALANQLVLDDLRHSVHFYPKLPLQIMLDAALRLDRDDAQWRPESVEKKPLVELLKTAIRVPVRQKGWNVAKNQPDSQPKNKPTM